MSDITIRRARRTDVSCLSELLIELFCIETDFIMDAAKHKTGLSVLLLDPERSTLFVAEEESSIIGMVSGQLVVSTAVGGYSLLLEDMFVLPQYRRRHVGRMLLETISEWAREKGALRIQLVADRENHPALMFYRKNDFKQGKMVGMYKSLESYE
jgi:GNAT superfamily N-acetyltransferase